MLYCMLRFIIKRTKIKKRVKKTTTKQTKNKYNEIELSRDRCHMARSRDRVRARMAMTYRCYVTRVEDVL